MSVKGYSNSIQNAKLENFLEPEFMKIDNTFWPTKGDFVTLWDALSGPQREVVAAAVSARTMGDLISATGKRPGYLVDFLKRSKNVGRAVMTARMCHLPSDKAREIYITGFLRAQKSRQFYYDEIQKVIKTDKDHLVELASKLTTDGDGKRDILKMIVAYGMQVKKLEDATICSETGVELAPMVVGIADARMAFNALQELNRMDGEYGQEDRATSSIEGQAERVKRLASTMNTAAKEQAKVVNAIAKRVATRDLRALRNSSDDGV